MAVTACSPAATQVAPTQLAPMSSADAAACKGVAAPRPTPPDVGPDNYYLFRMHDALEAEVTGRGGEFVSMYTDEARKMFVIGAPHPTKAMCDDLHARFGPWIEVVQTSGPEEFNGDHTGDPVTYASGLSTPAPANATALSGAAAAGRVMEGLSADRQLAGIRTRLTPSGVEVAVTLTRNDDRVPDVWLANLAVGAVVELMHTDESATGDLISIATATGPGSGGKQVTTDLGIGAVRLGQVFGSPSDSILADHVADVANRYRLEVGSLQILHPLESAFSVNLVVPNNAMIDWTIDDLRTALIGSSPNVEGVFIELDSADGQPLLQSGVAYRTGGGGLWFAQGQDGRFGAVHGLVVEN